MLKRIATLLLGIGLIGLGVFFFVAPERSYALQLMTRFWPVFLILAGLVRLAGHLIDRHPASPVGGLMISAIGGIMLSANLRGEHSFIRIPGTYWFWLLLACIIGRVLRQYTAETGKRTRAFSAGGLAIMSLIVALGLSANFLGRNDSYLKNLNARLGRMAGVRDYLFGNHIEIEDDPAQVLDLKAESRLVIDGSSGEVKVIASSGPAATLRLIKRIRSVSDEQARQIASKIHLSVAGAGADVRLKVDAADIESDFNTLIEVSIPEKMKTSVEVFNALGATTLQGLHGDHVIRDGEQVEVSDQDGSIRIENPRGSVTLSDIRGDVELLNYRRNAELRGIKGRITLDLKGGNTVIDQVSGPVRARITDARIEMTAIGAETSVATEPVAIIEDCRNGRLNFNGIKGPLKINSQNTRIDIDTVSGNVTIDNSSGRTIARHITGSAQFRSRDGSIELDGVTGPVTAVTTQDITVSDFRSTLDLATRIGKIEITTNDKVSGAVKAVNDKGRIIASLPEDAEFRVDASSRFGRVRVRGFDQLKYARKEASAIEGANLLDTAPTVTLRTGSGDIQLISSGAAVPKSDF